MKILFSAFLVFAASLTHAQEWAWMGGAQQHNATGVYGSLLVPSSANAPGARAGAASWTDRDGNFWLYGGRGLGESNSGLLNDLWKYSYATRQWTWISGQKNPNTSGRYDNGEPHPGARENAVTWSDKQGVLWLFGGQGLGKDNSVGLLNDLWKYSAQTQRWTFVGGSEETGQTGLFGQRGKPSRDNIPGARYRAIAWTDNNGHFWLFGGYVSVSEIDRPTVPDPPEEPGKPDNPDKPDQPGKPEEPGKPDEPGKPEKPDKPDKPGKPDKPDKPEKPEKPEKPDKPDKPDHSGPGKPEKPEKPDKPEKPAKPDEPEKPDPHGHNSEVAEEAFGEMNDLWMYSPATGEWTWVGGDNTPNANARFGEQGKSRTENDPGARQAASGWKDNNGNFWMCGGKKSSAILTDLWKFDVSRGEWVWMSGDKKNNQPAKNNNGNDSHPGSRALSSTWVDGSNDLWLLGGEGVDETGAKGSLNSVWKYSISNDKWTLVKGNSAINLQAVYGVNGSASSGNTPGGIYNAVAWKAPDEDAWIFGGQTGDDFLGALWSFAGCKVISGTGTRYPDLTTSANVQLQLTAQTSGETYEWLPYTGLDDPNTKNPFATIDHDLTYTVHIGTQNGCSIVDTQLVKIVPGEVPENKPKVGVPSAFSPNHNNVNDRLRPLGEIQKIDYFRVYNRWGIMVYQTSVIGEGWDGLYKGSPQQSDTYTWILLGRGKNDEPLKMSGKTVLVR